MTGWRADLSIPGSFPTVVLVALVALLPAAAPPPAAAAVPPVSSESCAPLDVALVLDTSTSMDPAIDGVKDGLTALLDSVEKASGGDYRIGLIDFGGEMEVHVPFAAGNAEAVRDAIPGLRQEANNDGLPEMWDEALHTVISGQRASEVPDGMQTGDFATPWRQNAEKLIILVSDARPAGFDDDFDDRDADRARLAAARAAEGDIRIASIFVPNGNDEGEDAAAILESTGEGSGGTYFSTDENGQNLVDGVNLAVATCAKDTDGDGLFDVWEEKGFDADGDGTIDVDLPAMGADPRHKDLFVHVGWMIPDGARPCAFLVWFCGTAPDGPHPPSPEALQRLVKTFADSPVRSPDGTTGIRVHVDAAEYTPEDGIPEPLRQKVLIPHSDGIAEPGVSEDEQSEAVQALESSFPDERRALFTFVAYVHRLDREDPNEVMGFAAGIPGDMMIVAGDRVHSDQMEAVTLIHELGHTLGLAHGGADHYHGKPNYPSLMNYDHAHAAGVTIGTSKVLDFSRWDLAPLDEVEGMDEAQGIGTDTNAAEPVSTTGGVPVIAPPAGLGGAYRCGGDPDGEALPVEVGKPVDWDCDGNTGGTAESVVHRDDGEGALVLESRNDWRSLVFTGGVRGGLESPGEAIPDGEEGLGADDFRATPKDFEVTLRGPGAVAAPASAPRISLPFFVENLGERDDRYTVSAVFVDPGSGASGPKHPAEVEIASRKTGWFTVDIPRPRGLEAEDGVAVRVSIRSRGSDVVGASEVVQLTAGVADSERTAQGRAEVSPDPVRSGDELTVTGVGFAPGTPVSLGVDGEGWALPASTVAGVDGRVTFRFPAPETPQRADIQLVGLDDDAVRSAGAAGGADVADESPDLSDIETRRLESTVEVEDGRGMSPLLLASLIVGLGLLLLVIAIVVMRRRRSRTDGTRHPGRRRPDGG